MTFLKRYGMSAIGFTMIVTVIVTQFAIVVVGFAKLDEEFVIKIAFIDVIEGGVAAAAVLISFGAVLGKVNPLQLLFMGLIETIFVVLNLHIGYHVLGIADVGGQYLSTLLEPTLASRSASYSGDKTPQRVKGWKAPGKNNKPFLSFVQVHK